jgi:hypothetical protein
MDRQTKEAVKHIAKQVRNWAEDRAFSDTYNDNHDLCGYCAIASAELFFQLKNNGFDPMIVAHDNDGNCHVFIELFDHIIDVTATQFYEFENTKVVILHSKEALQYDFYEPTVIFDHPKKLVKWQKKMGWPLDQTASNISRIKDFRR